MCQREGHHSDKFSLGKIWKRGGGNGQKMWALFKNLNILKTYLQMEEIETVTDFEKWFEKWSLRIENWKRERNCLEMGGAMDRNCGIKKKERKGVLRNY